MFFCEMLLLLESLVGTWLKTKIPFGFKWVHEVYMKNADWCSYNVPQGASWSWKCVVKVKQQLNRNIYMKNTPFLRLIKLCRGLLRLLTGLLAFGIDCCSKA